MQTRIYVVQSKATPRLHRLVDATSQAQAIRHVAQDEYHCQVATTKDLAALMREGVQVETANPSQGGQVAEGSAAEAADSGAV